jgi:hypothetical protein
VATRARATVANVEADQFDATYRTAFVYGVVVASDFTYVESDITITGVVNAVTTAAHHLRELEAASAVVVSFQLRGLYSTEDETFAPLLEVSVFESAMNTKLHQLDASKPAVALRSLQVGESAPSAPPTVQPTAHKNKESSSNGDVNDSNTIIVTVVIVASLALMIVAALIYYHRRVQTCTKEKGPNNKRVRPAVHFSTTDS